MKVVCLLLTLAVVLAASSEDTSNFIVGGEDATIQQYPYMAGVFNLGLHTCGGTIISASNVLTAAHCISFRLASSVTVSVGGSRRRGQDGTSYRALRVSIHPDYYYTEEPFKLQNDIAVIRTIRQIQFGLLVRPIGLNPVNVPAAAQVVHTGWGLLGDSNILDRADQLQKLSMVSIPNFACSVIHIGTVGQGVVSAEDICVVAGNNAGACAGDSGGPITYQNTVVGVASWTVRPCGSYPTVFVRVSYHYQWIIQQL